ncbi:hypothetical protein LMG1873_00968 [Achromobacter piechaudii]|uniref:Uncharacterized protein n=1 Tax=Achromobacter piechaudii TaxID=72556 RepID=A0A6S7CAW6_9BURK|nr:hypothetical protein LMG1873_00968 [Achromobacter piechaudii]CAB3832513.1 hypothetical protein LMG2828_01044 [Achromobacter piechaudii]CAB3839314.1 hypothetical protein LMG1861_01199 [Achromobacter piechaudii]CAB3943729.1 hypothetical protein LMG6103_00723 [Achromobacter piechaudii]
MMPPRFLRLLPLDGAARAWSGPAPLRCGTIDWNYR